MAPDPDEGADSASSPSDVYTVTLAGEIDLGCRHELRTLAVGFIREGAANAVVDLSAVTFLDSTALGFLVRLRLISQRRGGHVTLRGPKRAVHQLLESVAFDRVFVIEPPATPTAAGDGTPDGIAARNAAPRPVGPSVTPPVGRGRTPPSRARTPRTSGS